MAEQEVQTEATQTPEPHQFTEIEQRAASEGWVPQEEWTGDPDQWRPAKEFVDRGELFRKIEDQKRELKQVRAAIEDLGRHHRQVKEIAYKEALATLRAQKKEALEAGDADAVIALDDKIADTREAQKQAMVEPQKEVHQPQEQHPEVVKWENRNKWYQTDPIMKGAADELARSMVGRGITDPMVVLSEVEKQIRKEFPQKFENPNRSKAGAVETSTRPASARANEPVMSDAEKAIMKRIIATGAITKEKYLEEFKARQGG